MIHKQSTYRDLKSQPLFQVLDGLLEEDDEVVETWYLLGWVNSLRATFESKADNGKQVQP